MKLFFRTIFKIFLILPILFGCATTGADRLAGGVNADEDAVIQTYETCATAWKTGDVETLKQLYHPEFTVFYESGGQIQTLNWDAINALFDAGTTFEGKTELDVKVYGNTAITTGIEERITTPHIGAQKKVRYRISITWLKVAGRWQMVHEHQSQLRGDLSSKRARARTAIKADPKILSALLVPRVNAAGEQELDYIYAIPEKIDDGWDVSSLADEGLNTALIELLIRKCLDGKTFPKTDSVLIARNGKLVLEEYFHRQTREKQHTLQSATKSVTSMLVGIAIERGEIEGVEQLVYPIFPEYKGRKWIDEEYDITLKDVLTMTGGLDWDETSLPFTNPKNDNTAMNLSGDWIGYTLDKGRAFKPGEKFVYCSGLSILLGGIIKNSTGMYADEYAEKHLLGPLGITEYMWIKSPQWIRHTGGGLSLRPMDLLKLGQVMLDGGTWKGKRILPEKWTKDSLEEHARIHEKIQYGYQWWLYTFKTPNGPVKTAMGMGYGGQYIMIAPTLNLVAVTTAHNFKGAGKSWEKKFSDYILPAAQ